MNHLNVRKSCFLMALLLVASCSKDVTNNINQTSEQSKTNAIQKAATDGEASLDISDASSKANFLNSLGAHPNQKSVDYFSIDESIDATTQKKNLFVSGKTVVIAYDSATDIKSTENLANVTIEAEELIIKKELSFPGANVTLNVQKLTFEGNGKISTTPKDFPTMAESKADGKKGLRAGDIILNVKEMNADLSQTRFDVSGGRGQAAGLGVVGKAGKSIYPLYENTNIIKECTTYTYTCYEPEIGNLTLPGTTTECKGSNEIPGEGAPGEAAGHPGAGGDAGNIYAGQSQIASVKGISLVNAGPIGAIAPDTNYGAHGTPVNYQISNLPGVRSKGRCSSGGGGKSHSVNFAPINKSDILKNFNETISITKVIPSPKSPVENSTAGEFKTITASAEGLSTKLFIHKLDYAKDLYRNNYFAESQTELQKIIDSTKDTNDEVQLALVSKEAQQLLNQLMAQKDFYGMNLDAVPQISLEKILAAYKKEIEDSFETLKFTSYFSNKVKTAEEKKNYFIQNKNKLSIRIDQLKEENDEAYRAFPELNKEIDELQRDQESFNVALVAVEKEIEAEAQRNIDIRDNKKKLLGAVKLVSTLAKVFPAGQPAAAAIGTSIDAIVAATEKQDASVLDRLKDGVEIYQDIRAIDVNKSKQDWNEKYRNLSQDKFMASHPEIKDHKFEQYLKSTYETTKPLYDAANTYYKNYIAAEVPRSEYEAEVQRIKSINPRFKTLVEQLSLLQAQKERINNLLSETLAKIGQTESEINKSFTMMAAIDSDYLNFTNGLNFSVDDSIKFYEKSAKDSLLKYKLLLAKASTYRLLTPFSGNLDIRKIEEQLTRFASSNGETIDIDMLKRLYKTDLSKIAADIFNKIESGSLKEYESEITLDLNRGEIAALLNNQQVAINLKGRGLLKENEQNARIISIALDDIVLGSFVQNQNIDFIVTHSGQSLITKDGVEYKFTHPNSHDLWISRIDLSNGSSTLLSESTDTENLFSVLFDDNSAQGKGSLYSRVGFNSKFFIKLSGNVSNVNINYAQLKIKYSFSNKN
ncbi:MAG: hypothetical protein ACXVLQ_09085 [Bacteriovorax sp.]